PAHRKTDRRGGQESPGPAGNPGAHGAGAALLLGHELRRNRRRARRAPRLRGRGAAARAARIAAGARRKRRPGGGRCAMSSPPEFAKGAGFEHLDEMTCMLYLEGQLERARALEVSAHAQGCASCRTLLRAMEREARLLTRAMLEEEEPLPAR